MVEKRGENKLKVRCLECVIMSAETAQLVQGKSMLQDKSQSQFLFSDRLHLHVLYITRNSYQFPPIKGSPAVLLRLKLIGYLLSQQAHTTCIHLYIMLE